MAVPSVATYSAAALVAAQTSLLGLIDAGTGPGYIAIRDAADVLLGTIVLDDPGGAVSGTTGQLTLDIDVQEDAAVASGTAAYCELCDSDDAVILALPTQAGTVAVSGKLVLNTLSIVEGGPVGILSATIG
jgi:hypothetical protein